MSLPDQITPQSFLSWRILKYSSYCIAGSAVVYEWIEWIKESSLVAEQIDHADVLPEKEIQSLEKQSNGESDTRPKNGERRRNKAKHHLLRLPQCSITNALVKIQQPLQNLFDFC